jgi:hypothetical protein
MLFSFEKKVRMFLLSFEKRMDLDRWLECKPLYVTFLSARARILYLFINEMLNLKTIIYSAML